MGLGAGRAALDRGELQGHEGPEAPEVIRVGRGRHEGDTSGHWENLHKDHYDGKPPECGWEAVNKEAALPLRGSQWALSCSDATLCSPSSN